MIGEDAEKLEEIKGFLVITVDDEDIITNAVTTDPSGKSYCLWLRLEDAVGAVLDAEEQHGLHFEILEVAVHKLGRKIIGVV